MTDEYKSQMRQHQLLEERVRGISLVVWVLLAGIVIGAAIIAWGAIVVLGAAAVIALLVASFLKPEMSLLVVTLLAPLVKTDPNSAEYSRFFTTLIPGTGITVVNGLVLMLVAGAFVQRFSTRPPEADATEVDKPLLLFLAWSALAIATGILYFYQDDQAIGEWLQLACGYIVYWVARRRWRVRGLIPVAVAGVLAMTVYESVLVIQQYLGLNHAAFNWDLKEKIFGTFPPGNSNDIGTYVATYGLLALGLYMGQRRSFWRWPSLAVSVVATAATFATYSRGAAIGLVAGGLCMVLYKQRRYLLPAIAVLAILPALLPSSMSSRFGNADDSAESRKDTWTRAAVVTIKHPIFGVGWRGYNKDQSNQGYKLRDPHNMYLLVSAEQGLPGIALFVGILMGAGTVLTRILREKHPPFTEALALGLFGALISLAVSSVFGSRMIYLYVVEHFFLLLGLVVVLAQRPRDTLEAPPPVEETAPAPVSPWRYRSYV